MGQTQKKGIFCKEIKNHDTVKRLIQKELIAEKGRDCAGELTMRKGQISFGTYIYVVTINVKPYGFCVHGGIDGFSRRLIWLEVRTTNNNPEVITKFYLDAVKQVGGLPRKVRSGGTENSMVGADLTFLRSSHSDEDAGLGCFLTGRSTAN